MHTAWCFVGRDGVSKRYLSLLGGIPEHRTRRLLRRIQPSVIQGVPLELPIMRRKRRQKTRTKHYALRMTIMLHQPLPMSTWTTNTLFPTGCCPTTCMRHFQHCTLETSHTRSHTTYPVWTCMQLPLESWYTLGGARRHVAKQHRAIIVPRELQSLMQWTQAKTI